MATALLKMKRATTVGASVNSIPSSFEGLVKLPKDGVVGDTYDFDKVVKTNKKSSRLVVDMEGKITNDEGVDVAFNKKSSILWGTSIEQLMDRADRAEGISVEGEKVFAILKSN